MADRTPSKRYSLETSVCRNCNGNIVLKSHPLDLFGKKADKEGILQDLEKFCGFKITFEDCFPARKQSLLKSLNFRSLLRWLFIPEFGRIQKRGKSLVDSPAASSSPTSGREKTKSKVSRFRDVYVLTL